VACSVLGSAASTSDGLSFKGHGNTYLPN